MILGGSEECTDLIAKDAACSTLFISGIIHSSLFASFSTNECNFGAVWRDIYIFAQSPFFHFLFFPFRHDLSSH